jgi:hypothetical protein
VTLGRVHTVLGFAIAGGIVVGALSAAALGLAVELLRRGLLRCVGLAPCKM